MLFRELMTENFSLIGEWSSIAEARIKLLKAAYLLVTSNEGLPLTVITRADLPLTAWGHLTKYIPKLPPTVLIGCDLEVSDVYEMPTEHLLSEKTRGAALLGEQGLVGVVPTDAIRSYLNKSAWKRETVRVRTIDQLEEELPTEHTIPFNFGIHGKATAGANSTRFMRIAAAGNLGGNRAVPAIPRKCRKCGWVDLYSYILPATICTNPDKTVEPQPWPHSLG